MQHSLERNCRTVGMLLQHCGVIAAGCWVLCKPAHVVEPDLHAETCMSNFQQHHCFVLVTGLEQ
jgi:hypothetical protein